MLNLKTALITLVLGSSSVALASPSVSFTADAQASFGFGPEVRDHRAPAYGMPARMSWIQLSAPTSLRNGRAVIRPQLARISQLRLQASLGMTYVQNVELRFRDGSYQTLPVNRWLTLASPIDLSLRSRGMIDSITVIGSARRSATYQVLAQGSRFEAPQPPVYQPPIYQPPVQASPAFTLGQNLGFYGTNGSRVMTVGAVKGAFNTLRLEGAGAGTFIQMVQIDFADGTQQFQDAVNKTLAPAEVYDISLDGLSPRSVQRVIVWTNNNGYTTYGANSAFSAALL